MQEIITYIIGAVIFAIIGYKTHAILTGKSNKNKCNGCCGCAMRDELKAKDLSCKEWKPRNTKKPSI